MTQFLQVVTTCAKREDALVIAEALIELGLAACVQVTGPVASVYRWQGVIERAEEWQVLVKTSQLLYPAVEEAIVDHHPYDVPEILAFPVVEGHAAYLTWLEAELNPPGAD